MNQPLENTVAVNPTPVNFTPKQIRNFWKKVDKTESCWNWTGAKTHGGYGNIFLNKKFKSAHRMSWEIHFGRIPKGEGIHGISVCHKCDNRACVNPVHLFLGTHTDNMRDAFSKKRIPRAKGSLHHNSKLKESDVIKIKRLFKNGMNKTAIGKIFGVSDFAIYFILKGKSWTHVN